MKKVGEFGGQWPLLAKAKEGIKPKGWIIWIRRPLQLGECRRAVR